MASAAGRAREAQHVATPVVRSAAASAAEALSDAAEHAAEVLAETAGRLAQPVAEHADELQLNARSKLADAGEQLARSIRPRRRRRLRRALIGAGVVGVGAGVWLSPIGARLRMLVGMGPAVEPAPPAPGIVLPSDPAPAADTGAEAAAPAEEPGANGDRVPVGGRTRGSTKKSS
jgi:hypothetical protein